MASYARNLMVSVLFTLFGGPALVLALFPWYITHFRIPAGQSAGMLAAAGALVAAGLVPLLESIFRFVMVGRGTLVPVLPTEHLVVSGLYRHVRNPMYTGVITVLAGEGLLFRNGHMVVYLGIIWLIMHLFVSLYEEPTLARRYGEEYARFKRNVPRWIPRVTPWRSRENY